MMEMANNIGSAVRASLKREAVAYDTARSNAPDDVLRQQFSDNFTAVSVKLKNKERQLSDFLEKTGQLPDNARAQVLGFGRSQAQKAVWAEKNDLTNKSFNDIIRLKRQLSNVEVRKWYLAHDKTIPDLINKSLPIEQQARQACELRNKFRTQARDLMADQNERKKLDVTDPNRSFEELLADKMERKSLTREQAIEDILNTATITRKSVNKSLGLEE